VQTNILSKEAGDISP